MIRTTLRFLVDALSVPPPAPPPPLSPREQAVRLVSDLVPIMAPAVWHGIPLKEIRTEMLQIHEPRWERDHGRTVAREAELLLCQLGPIVFLSDDEARRAGLVLPPPTRRNRR